MSDRIKAHPGKVMDRDDIPSSHLPAVTLYIHSKGVAIAVEEPFRELLQKNPDDGAQLAADMVECLKRALNSARGVA
jgi:hypothetical protein